jgi:hypothetical protein
MARSAAIACKCWLLSLVLPAAPIEATANTNLAARMPLARSLQLDPPTAQLAVPRFDPWLPVTADRDLSIFLNIILKFCIHICSIVTARGRGLNRFAFTELDPVDVWAIGNLIGWRFHRPVERVPHRRRNTLRQIEPKPAAFAAPHHRSLLVVQTRHYPQEIS